MSEQATVQVQEVKTKQVNGKTLWEVKDGNGLVYSTFKPDLGNSAQGFEGGPARIEFTEKQNEKNGTVYTNRYLDSISAAQPPAKGSPEYQQPEVDWDGKERRAHIRATWAIAATLSQHTAKSDETPKRIYERVKPIQQALMRDIYEGAELPAPQDADLYPGLSGSDEDIPF